MKILNDPTVLILVSLFMIGAVIFLKIKTKQPKEKVEKKEL